MTMRGDNSLKPILQFLTGLKENNNKTWFENHRSDYDSARGTFEQFITELINQFRASDQLHDLSAKDCIARIYRDIRFTKDKSPYKTNFSAMVAPGGWRSSALGYYIAIEPFGRSMVAGGLYNPTPEELNRFRQAISEDASEFKQIVQEKAFIKAFGTVEGERLKTAPKGYDRNHPDISLLQLRQITAIHRFSDQDVLDNDLVEQIVPVCQAMKPFLGFLSSIR
jgi:uncharacterized protein (TIGR02453 family)